MTKKIPRRMIEYIYKVERKGRAFNMMQKKKLAFVFLCFNLLVVFVPALSKARIEYNYFLNLIEKRQEAFVLYYAKGYNNQHNSFARLINVIHYENDGTELKHIYKT